MDPVYFWWIVTNLLWVMACLTVGLVILKDRMVQRVPVGIILGAVTALAMSAFIINTIFLAMAGLPLAAGLFAVMGLVMTTGGERR